MEKIELENVLEAESEAHVNRLSRELAILRATQQQQQQPSGDGVGYRNINSHSASNSDPTVEVMLEALRRENEQLRNRLVDVERDYIRTFRLNEIYREELIDHRNRVSIVVTGTDP